MSIKEKEIMLWVEPSKNLSNVLAFLLLADFPKRSLILEVGHLSRLYLPLAVLQTTHCVIFEGDSGSVFQGVEDHPCEKPPTLLGPVSWVAFWTMLAIF